MLTHRAALTAVRSLRVARLSTSSIVRASPAPAETQAISEMKPVKQDVGAPVEFSQMPYDPQLGDYPQLPAVSRQWRQPGDQWWDKQDRRNFGEPVHEQDEVLTVWAPDVYPVSGPSAIFQFSMACLVFTAFGVILSFVRPDRPAVPREYPYNGLAEHLGGEINKANTAEDEE